LNYVDSFNSYYRQNKWLYTNTFLSKLIMPNTKSVNKWKGAVAGKARLPPLKRVYTGERIDLAGGLAEEKDQEVDVPGEDTVGTFSIADVPGEDAASVGALEKTPWIPGDWV
jgi:hypothetical protein